MSKEVEQAEEGSPYTWKIPSASRTASSWHGQKPILVAVQSSCGDAI